MTMLLCIQTVDAADGAAPLAGQKPGSAGKIPFAFTYGGTGSAVLLPGWKCEEMRNQTPGAGRESWCTVWRDPATGLEVRYEVTRFADPPAVDWVLRFTNTGTADSPILEAVLPLDIRIEVPAGEVWFHHAQGSTAGATDFLPVDDRLVPGASVSLEPNGGCSSDGVLPFFNLAWSGGGLAWAVGWSGQWSQQVQRDAAGQVGIRAGQQTFRAKLRPGESIRTPRILLVAWQGGDRMCGHNQLRQTILAHYAPRLDGKVVLPPISQNSWFTYECGNRTTEVNQLALIRTMPSQGVETFWLDAGWFEGGWPKGHGSWIPKADHYPRGLKPLGDEAHRLGLSFLLWFAPELVTPTSRIAKEHPEFVLLWKDFQKGEGLFNMGDPAACAWMTEFISKRITDWGVDIYRTDFGGQPLLYWQKKDETDRQGITENHYVEGLYTMWDELRRRHPRLIFDDCASGGRRIDLELISRSYVLSRSDTVTLNTYSSAWDQAQTAGLSLYVPVNATISTCGIPGSSSQATSLYALRSAATSGFSISQDTSAKDHPAGLFKQVIDEVKMLRPYYSGDFHPLTPINVSEDVWCAWQFDRPDLGQGFAMFFRRPQAVQATFTAALQGLEPTAGYEVRFVDGGTTQKMSGEELARLTVGIPVAPGSLLINYRKLGQGRP